MLRERLRELREEHGLNQEEFANKLNVGRSTYASWEIGRSEPDVATLINIANFYNISLDYLCGNTDIKNSYYKDSKLCRHINQFMLLYKDILKDQ